MTYQLSLLDKSLVPQNETAVSALRWTTTLAQRAEQLGYRRYWVAEHHGSSTVAGSAPEILIAHLLARTSRIRVGSGGVMLQHYSPFKVAETFGLLASLAPGRVDLGIGRAPGGFPRTTRALQQFHDPARKPDFAGQLSDLDSFLTGVFPPGHPLADATAAPAPPEPLERILLGGSPESAELAARLGWEFCYAGHFNDDALALERSLDAYRHVSNRPPMLALYAFAADSQQEAERLVGELRLTRLHLATGQSVNLPTPEAAAEFARQSGVTEYRTEERRPHVLAGTPEKVHSALRELSQRHGVKEFIIDTPVSGFAERLASIELLAAARKVAAA
jgi:luciferase family oxidoreductase group 1